MSQRVSIQDIKAYLEGLPITIEYAYVTSGDSSQAIIGLSHLNKYALDVLPGTLLHLFIYEEFQWRFFFAGKLTGKVISNGVGNNSIQLHFINLFSELNNAVMAPLDMSDSVWGHSLTTLYVSTPDLIKRDGNPSDVIIVGNAGQLDFFNFQELQKKGSVADYVKGLLKAASYVSPWYKVQSDMHKLDSGYYVLDNPNIFPVAGLTTMANYINSAYSKLSSQLTYEQILNALLYQLMYKKKFLNTPVKINGEWKWVIIYPDPTWLPSYKEMTFTEKDIVQIQIEESESYPTRVFLQMNSGDAVLDKTGARPKFLFSHPDLPYIVDGNKERIAFTEEEKYRGPALLIDNLTNMESYYPLVDWSKPVKDLRAEAVTLKEESGMYFNQLAEFKFLNARRNKTVGSTIIPIHDPKIRPIFPIKLNLQNGYDYNINISSVMYTITPSHADMNIMPESFIDVKEFAEELSWAPDEYKNRQSVNNYYKQFSYELMTEAEFWEYNNLPDLSKYPAKYYNSSNLNAQYIINNSTKNIKTLMGGTIFSAERAEAVVNYIKESGKGSPVITIARNQLNMNIQKEATVPAVSKGGVKYEKPKEPEKSFSKELVTSIFTTISSTYPITDTEANKLKISLDNMRQYNQYIEDAAKETGIDANLIRAIISEESTGKNSGTPNPMQALGLMQIRRIAAEDTGMNWESLVNPKLNIQCGSRYLAKLLTYYNGNISNALAAYNWGMGYFDKVGKDLTQAPLATQNYVRVVLGNYKSLQGQ